MNSTQLSISLEFDKRQYKAVDRQNLRFSLKNESGEDMQVLTWHTPLDGFNHDMFHVEHAGKKAVYLGRVVKRGLPGPEDYILIKPGESVSGEVDLGEAYDIAKAGDYQVTYRARILDVKDKKLEKTPKGLALAEKGIVSPVATFRLLQERRPRQINGIALDWMQEMERKVEKGISFRNCTAEQERILKEAHAEALRLATEARKVLSGTKVSARPAAKRYLMWFGEYDKKRYATASTHFLKIRDALGKKNVVFNADCSKDWYAYVYPAKPYEIFLCNQFWQAPLLGTDCKAGAIIHETSHFYVVAGTEDHEYGQNSCKRLAKINPGNAIANADSHEYFTENNPKLSM